MAHRAETARERGKGQRPHNATYSTIAAKMEHLIVKLSNTTQATVPQKIWIINTINVEK